MQPMPKRRPPHLHREMTRHETFVWYVRRDHGPRIRIRAEYDTKEFWEEYNAAIAGAPVPQKTSKANSLQWALDRYRESSAWAGLAVATRRSRENIFRQVIKTGGTAALSAITAETILAGRERRSATPHAANAFLKAMRSFFDWAAGDGRLVKSNPCIGVKLLKGKNDDVGHHTWTEDEIERFEKRWPLGTRERLAFDLLLYTGLRRGDVVRLGRQHVRDGAFTMRTEKTGEVVTLPILPPLAESIRGAETGDLTFLITQSREAFSKAGFGNWFREAARTAKCPGAAHGLRKAGAVRAALNGATTKQLMAMYGWTNEKQAEHYTRSAEKARLAADGAQALMKQKSNKKRPHLRSGAGDVSKSSTKRKG